MNGFRSQCWEVFSNSLLGIILLGIVLVISVILFTFLTAIYLIIEAPICFIVALLRNKWRWFISNLMLRGLDCLHQYTDEIMERGNEKICLEE